MLIIFATMILFVVFATLASFAKKVWERILYVLLVVAMFVGLLAFANTNPFAKIQEPEVSKVTDLSALNEGDTVILRNTKLQLGDNKVAADECYKITDLPDNCIYLFVDENNKLYYVEEDKVIVAILSPNGGFESESMYSYPAKVIKGEYEQAYAEKTVIKSKVTLWSVNSTISTEYTFYIPEDVS